MGVHPTTPGTVPTFAERFDQQTLEDNDELDRVYYEGCELRRKTW